MINSNSKDENEKLEQKKKVWFAKKQLKPKNYQYL